MAAPGASRCSLRLPVLVESLSCATSGSSTGPTSAVRCGKGKQIPRTGEAPGNPQGEPRQRLTCPPIALADLQGAPSTIDADAIRAVGARYAAPASAFGLELKVAYALEAAGHGGDRLRRPYYRPAQEPFVWSWWAELQQVPLDPEAMLALASLLNGKAVAYREKEMFSAGAPGAPGMRYETPERARRWLADIAAADAGGGDPVKQALYRFARIVMAHPFTDANGRFARAALQAGLARGGLIATPCLALAPAFCLRGADIRLALADLSHTGDWQAYFERMGDVLMACVHWVAAV